MKYKFDVVKRDEFPSLKNTDVEMRYNEVVEITDTTIEGAITALQSQIESEGKILVSFRLTWMTV